MERQRVPFFAIQDRWVATPTGFTAPNWVGSVCPYRGEEDLAVDCVDDEFERPFRLVDALVQVAVQIHQVGGALAVGLAVRRRSVRRADELIGQPRLPNQKAEQIRQR